MKKVIALAIAVTLCLGVSAWSQDSTPQASTGAKTARKKTAARAKTPSVSVQVQQMKEALDAQQKQIEELRSELQSRDQSNQQLQQQMTQLQSTLSQAQTKADQATQQASQQETAVSSLKGDVDTLKQNATNTATTLQEEQKRVGELESPLAIHFKGVTLTPGGFLAAETVYRQKALAADINTPFNSIPFDGASQDHLSEFFGSGRQSRITLLAEGKLGSSKLNGYYEADFLSAAVTSNNNQSNSYSLRQRQLYAQAALNNGWAFTGGQMWSLVTETKKGLDNRSEALPMTIDPQYTIGFSWARQYGFRVTKNFSNKAWLGLSVENPQTTFTAHGTSPNFLIGNVGQGGGLYNLNANYSFNRAPDFIGKLAFEPGWGHYEIFGVVSTFRDRIFPGANDATPTADGASNQSTTGGGIGGNIRGSLAHKHMDVGLHFLGGKGIGRYGTAGLADATVRSNGELNLLRSYQGLGTIEFHWNKADIYLNGGGEYAGRSFDVNSSGKQVGYGAPTFKNTGCSTEQVPSTSGTPVSGFNPGSLSNCTGDTRAIFEGTFGFWYKPYNGPKGKIQIGPQYSYIVRNTWAGTGGQPQATDNMFLTSFRYYLP